jgi:hypothetical protein
MNIAWSKPSLLRDFALLSLMIVAGLFVVTCWVTFTTYRDHSERILRQMETQAARLDRGMTLEIEHADYLLQGLGHQITFTGAHDLRSVALLLRSFDTAATQHHVFSWIDENQNNVVSSSRGVHPQGVSVSDRDYIQRSIAEPWRTQIGAPIQGRVSAKWVLPVALGVADIQGHYVGTILISMDIATLTRSLQNAIKDPDVSFLVANRDFTPLIHLIENGSALDAPQMLKALRSVDLERSPSGFLYQSRPFSPHSPYVYYEASRNYPLLFMLEMNGGASSRTLSLLLAPRLIQVLLMGVFMLVLLWVVKIRVIQPVNRLSQGAAGILRGEPYPATLKANGATGSGEVAQLSYQIKRLGDYFQETARIAYETGHKNRAIYQDLQHLRAKQEMQEKLAGDLLRYLSEAQALGFLPLALYGDAALVLAALGAPSAVAGGPGDAALALRQVCETLSRLYPERQAEWTIDEMKTTLDEETLRKIFSSLLTPLFWPYQGEGEKLRISCEKTFKEGGICLECVILHRSEHAVEQAFRKTRFDLLKRACALFHVLLEYEESAHEIRLVLNLPASSAS